MKKTLSFVFALLLALCLFSCGKAEDSPSDDNYLDLTKVSGTVVFGEISNMMYEPESYVGKTIKIKGNFAYMTDEETGATYYACIVPDATACCQNGIEFIWGDGSHAFSEYPESGKEITVEGVFRTYTEGGTEFMHLVDATLEF